VGAMEPRPRGFLGLLSRRTTRGLGLRIAWERPILSRGGSAARCQ